MSTARVSRAAKRPTADTSRDAAPVDVRLAAIDVGSNSIHMIVAQIDAAGGVTTLWRMKEMVGLGRISFPARRLSADAMDRAVATLGRFQQVARQRGCEKICAVATSAVREAENGGDFIERVRNELALRVRVVSGREEARLIYLGVRHATDLHGGPHLLLDIGGGSVEFIVATDTKPLLLESRKLGSARMTAKFIKSDPVDAKELASLLRHYRQELVPLCESIRALNPVKVFGCSGTLENLAAMCSTTAKSNGDTPPGVIERGALDSLTAILVESRAKDRAVMSGLDAKRQDQIIAGAVLVRELFQQLDLKRMYLCRAALREGILVDYLSRHSPELQIRREVPDPRRRSVLDLGRRCDWHQPHAEQVGKLALQLFDGLKSIHQLDRRDRELIEYDAMLHDIGWHISPENHHKHGMYLIQHGALKDFTPEEITIIALLARYHRKSKPKLTHESFAKLSPKARKAVRVGAAIIRIADSLDRTHCSAVSGVNVKLGNRRIKLTITARGDTEMELWAARRKMDLLAEVFNRTISFEVAKK